MFKGTEENFKIGNEPLRTRVKVKEKLHDVELKLLNDGELSPGNWGDMELTVLKDMEMDEVNKKEDYNLIDGHDRVYGIAVIEKVIF